MNLKCFWNTDGLLHFAEMWKPCISNHNESGEITPALRSNSSFQEISAECDGLFYMSTYTVYLQQGYCMCTWSMINVWGATGEPCNEERAHNAGLPIPRTAGMPIVSEACCAYSDFVNWISALFFPLQDQSLLVCHAGHVVIEQKIESEKEENWTKTPAQDMAEGKVRRRRQRVNEGRTRGWQRGPTSEKQKP